MKYWVTELPKEKKECDYSCFVNGQYRCCTKKLPECNLTSNASECHLFKQLKRFEDDGK
ncbi:MAG: hypothetical protein IJN43_13790 [Ruminococcus sp.]|nr:hypothetical protein [Ruminococcus sp.]